MVACIWSKVNGPGGVTFADASAVDTTASFSLPGAYVFRFTADDSALPTFDDITITAYPTQVNTVWIQIVFKISMVP
jgi:hypothetical protein